MSWSVAGVAKQVIPASAFSHDDPEGPQRAAAQRAAQARLEYEKILADVYALLNTSDAKGALARLEQAKADPKLALVRSELDRDMECAGYFEDINGAAAASATLLADKRAFMLTKADGKEMPVGQGAKNTVAGVKDENIIIDQDLGTAKATVKWKLAELSPQTR